LERPNLRFILTPSFAISAPDGWHVVFKFGERAKLAVYIASFYCRAIAVRAVPGYINIFSGRVDMKVPNDQAAISALGVEISNPANYYSSGNAQLVFPGGACAVTNEPLCN
jgi:hypothetical protein